LKRAENWLALGEGEPRLEAYARLGRVSCTIRSQMRRAARRILGISTVRTSWVILILTALMGAAAGSSGLGAQEAPPPASEPAATPSPVVEEVKPSGFYLRNDKGELVYVPDISYEQFEELLKIRRNLTDRQQPAFVLTDMAIVALAAGDRLEMKVTFTLQGRALEATPAGSWFPVPLRFDNAYLSEAPVFDGPHDHFLTFDGAQGGYVCWLQSGADEVHHVTLQLLLPIDQVGDESRVMLSVPTPLASSLALQVPDKLAEGSLRDLTDAVGRPLAFATTPEGGGQFTARGIRGNVALSWHAAHLENAADQRLDVAGEVVVTADEMLQEIRVDGRFTVRGFGGPLETFQVRLPPGMRWRESQEAGYSVRPLPPADDASSAPAVQVVEVRLDRPTAAEVDIHLLAEMPTAADDTDTSLTVARLIDQAAVFEPARFEFVGVVRHHGYIDLVVRGDWAFEDRDEPDFPRVGTGNTPTGPHAVVARYRYHNQQRSLQVSLRQKATRISVEPTYRVRVDAQQAWLTAELICGTSGSKAGPLAIRLPFWKVEGVRFIGLDSTPTVDLNNTNPLVVPIPIEVQTGKPFTLRIQARQDLTASVVSGTGPLRLVLPLLEATDPSRANVIVSPATVEIIATGNILLTPLPQQMKALSALAQAELLTNGVAGAAGDEPPGSTESAGAARFYYRDRGPSDQAVFVGEVRVQPQAIAVRVASTATLTRTSCTVEQRLSYTVLHEPADSLTFSLPGLSADGRVPCGLFLGSEPLIPSIEPGTGNDRPRVRVRLPRPTIGPIELTVQHPRQPLTGLTAESDARVSLPLLMPSTRRESNTTIVENALTVVRAEPLRVEAAAGGWIVDETKSVGDRLVLVTTAESVAPALRVSLRGAASGGTTEVYQAWVQSWVAPHQRRDRAVFRVRTRTNQLRVKLPRPVEGEVHLVKVAVDRREVPLDGPGPQGDLLVPVSGQTNGVGQEHVLEVWYAWTHSEPPHRSLDLQAATLDAVDRIERTYWQVILPAGDVVISGDPRMIPDQRWQWDGFGWRRRAARDQAALEQWIGASEQDPVPSETNRYLFTTLGAVGQLELVTVARSWVLLVCSGIALVCGLLLLYVPVCRHPALLLVVAVVTLAAGMFWPDGAILFAQCAALGVVLAVTAAACRLWLRRAYAGAPVVQGRAQLADSKIRLAEKGSARADGSSRGSATAVPASVQVPAAGSKS